MASKKQNAKNPTTRKAGAEESKASGSKKAAGKGGENPSVDYSRREKDARAGGKKAGRSSRGVGPACEKCGQVHKRCSAHNNRGGPCGQQPLRFQQVCRSHGGSTKLSRKAAQERMMELVWPAIARLDNLVNDPDTDPAIVVKVVSQILDRAHGAGLNKHASMDVGFGEDSAFNQMVADGGAIFVMRGEGNILDPADRPALGGVGDENDPETLNRHARLTANRGAADAETYLPSNDDADIVIGQVVNSRDSLTSDDGLMGFPQTNAQRRAKMRPTEHDPAPHHDPDEKPFARYEENLRRRIEDR